MPPVGGMDVTQQHKGIRIGQILVEQGKLSEQQVFEIIEAQRRTSMPFGLLAERMFDVTVDSIEQAWVEQYCRFTGQLDLEEVTVDQHVLKLINRRQAWQFEILPVRIESEGELLVAASRRRLARSVTFVAKRLEPSAFFRVVASDQLRAFLNVHYPLPGVTEAILDRASQAGRDEAA